ncbi:hypothetical protein ACJDU8_19780 [Clostridium sp. WILCCON 0269]|uniref:Uncharacterized protein n=1 Tax=Candidatus Clostridium eludens TaxID=3381663 RepID=A0ABW8SNZ8_9CLOT
MDIEEIIKWLEHDLDENIEIREGLVSESAAERIDKVIQALQEAIVRLKEPKDVVM